MSEEVYEKCIICKKDMLIKENRIYMGLPQDSHLDCLLKQQNKPGVDHE